MSLAVQAYEADIVRGSHASLAAASLELFDYETPSGTQLPSRKIGEALIRLGGNQLENQFPFPGDEDDLINTPDQTVKPANNDKNTLWVDRYAAFMNWPFL